MRYLFAAIGYIIAISALVGMVRAPFWNWYVDSKRIKQILKNK